MKYSYEEKLKMVKLYRFGISCTVIKQKYGVAKTDLFVWNNLYEKREKQGLKKRSNFKFSNGTKVQIVREHLEENLSLTDLCVKRGIELSAIKRWCKIAREQGYDALANIRQRGRPPKEMGRPKKKCEQTELEKLRERVKDLEAENALLKKVKSLVAERVSHLKKTGQKPSKN